MPDVPIVQSMICIDEILDWIKKSTQTIHHGRCGIEFLIQDDIIVGYEPIFRPHIKPRQVLVDNKIGG